MAAEAAVPRPSASVILVRDGPGGLETFMVRRHARSPVAPSAYVFPGGTVREDDVLAPTKPRADGAAVDPTELAATLSARSDVPVAADRALALYVCAVRELFEEASVLLVRERGREAFAVDPADTSLQERLEASRLALQARDLSLAQLLADWRWQPAFDLLVPFSHWITPTVLAARFDTWFFAAAMPPAQAALHDTIELSEGVWLPPADVLSGAYHTVYATARHLERLAPFASVADLLAFARAKPILAIQPEVVEGGGGLSVSLSADRHDRW